MQIGDKIEDFSFTATNGLSGKFSQFKGKNVVLYFYPKDSTPGCTMESKSFRDHSKDFAACDTIILGISKDSINSHEKFKAKHCMPFDLISDNDAALCNLFDVLKNKSLFGVKYIGIERSTFLIDKNGVLRQEWRKVKVLGHVEKVLAAAKSL
ncbi:MAG: alkyl hydroperoxide reductase/thiol specific antioxidant/Mal allergen [Gammaproteobacteria bacterium]|jgi:peroxiredoxin Q/BCP|nr:alkyl hydroperoxide reductase/thiol specific antioxidant/Mal allergen [Gammaproteobacteria bacterium]